MRTRITCCKNGMLRDEEVRAIEMDGVDFPAVYFGYREYLERNRRMDYDDQMVFALRILRRYPDILAHFQSKYPYLCVDEAQDTSKIQHAILRLLAARSRNLFMVGDEDQSIYGFRAAWPQALMEFRQIYGGGGAADGDQLPLRRGHRGEGGRLHPAQRQPPPKHMRASRPQGEPVRHVNLNDFGQQAHYLAQAAADCTESTAVLYRNNDSALPLIDLLERRGIPYACRQRESFFFTSPAVRDLTDVLCFALDGTDRERFLRIYYKLEVRVKRSVLQEKLRRVPEGGAGAGHPHRRGRLRAWQTGRLKTLRTHLSKLPQLSSFAALQRIVKYMGYGDYLSSQGGDKSRVELLLAGPAGAGGGGLSPPPGGAAGHGRDGGWRPGLPLCALHHPRQQGSGVRPGVPHRRGGRHFPIGESPEGERPVRRGAGGPGGGAAALLRGGHPGPAAACSAHL